MRSTRMRSHNPVFTKTLNATHDTTFERATYKGVAFKTMYYVALVVIGAFGGIFLLLNNPEAALQFLMVAGIGGFISAMVAIMSPRASRIAGSIYCLLQGTVVGVISLIAEAFAAGVVSIALLSTVAVLLVVATLYLTGIVRVNNKFLGFLSVFSISVLVAMLFIWIMSLFNIGSINEALAGGNMGLTVIISLVMIFLATLYLFFDLENIRQIVEGGHPKQMEWYVSFGLVFTIVWLYMELLPLLLNLLGNRE